MGWWGPWYGFGSSITGFASVRRNFKRRLVNVNKPSNFDTVDYTDPAGRVYPSIARYTTARMGSTERNVMPPDWR